MYLGLISLNSIFNFLGCVAEEMVGLALHRTKSALHPSHPFHYLPVPASPSTSVLWKQWIGDGLIRVKRERYLIIFIVFLTQIKHDSLPFEDSLLTSLSFGSGCSVDYCRDTTIRCWDYQYLCFKPRAFMWLFWYIPEGAKKKKGLGHVTAERGCKTYGWSSSTNLPFAHSSRYRHVWSHIWYRAPQAWLRFSGRWECRMYTNFHALSLGGGEGMQARTRYLFLEPTFWSLSMLIIQ